VQVSLDGATAAIHESYRGAGTFEPALQALHILIEEGLPATVRCTVHSRNFRDLPALARLLLEELNIPSFSTNSASSLGTHAKYDEEMFLKPAKRLEAMKILAALVQQYPGRLQASSGPLAEWHMFHDMEQARREGRSIPGRGRLVGCGCIFERIAVTSDGAYVPCVMLPQMILGYIGRDSLVDVWLNSPVLNALRARIHLPLADFEECQGCSYINTCTGNCAGNALSVLGSSNRPSPDACLRRFDRELAGAGLTMWEAHDG
jgi:SynChlorMet cassette radical SAM/SPASM protein ScmE